MGGQAGLTNAYLAALVSFTGLIVAGFAISAVLRLRSEETDQRADPVLATRAGRIGWALSHLVIAVGRDGRDPGRGGTRAGLGHGARSRLARQRGRQDGRRRAGAGSRRAGRSPASPWPCSASHRGSAPRRAGACSARAVLLLFFGATLRLSHWVLDVSPFTHVPRLPGGAVSAARWSGCA